VGDCGNLHGHTYELYVSISGELNKKGFIMDFKDLKKIVKELIISKIDHKYLNDIINQPTAENVVIWIWQQLKDKLNLHEVKLYETQDSYVTYNGKKN
jgi:6-pyruvoyltetrahydropterin/6-carboxytetrahydropterin synthase